MIFVRVQDGKNDDVRAKNIVLYCRCDRIFSRSKVVVRTE